MTGLALLLALGGCRDDQTAFFDAGPVADGEPPWHDGTSVPAHDGSVTPPGDAAAPPPKKDGAAPIPDTSQPPLPKDSGSPLLDSAAPAPAPIKVAAVQYGPGNHSFVSGCNNDICGLSHYITQAKGNGAQYVVTPEYATPQQYAELSPPIGSKPASDPKWPAGTIIHSFAKLAADLKITIIFNVIAQEGSGSTASLYNTQVVVDGKGVVIGRHYKYYLYGEASLTAGTECCDFFSTPAGKAGLLICADINCIISLAPSSSCTAKGLQMMNAFVAQQPHIVFFSSYWAAWKSPEWKATAVQAKFAQYANAYVVAANTIDGNYHGGGVFKPDGTAIQIVDQTSPGIAYGVIPVSTSPPTGDAGVPAPGSIVVTELMANPKAVADSAGEWIELYNAGSAAVNLSGWTLKDAAGNTHTIAPPGWTLNINPGQYLVLGNNADKATNGGVDVAYSYGNWTLVNTSDQIYLHAPGGALVSKVEYDSSWGIPDGASLSLKSPSLDSNVSSNWCVEKNPWPGSAGDKGTPGAKAGCAP